MPNPSLLSRFRARLGAEGHQRIFDDLVAQALAIAHKVLADRDNPKRGDRLVSLEDTGARFGYHHGSFCGYLLDLAMDAESELVTSINVLPANGDEAADAATLVRQEEEAHGNDVAALSADSVLFQGQKLRELGDPEGLGLEVFVPPVQPSKTDYFTPEDFELDETGQKLSCPSGKTTNCRYRNSRDSGWTYRYRRSDCVACPLREKCMKELPKQQGRAVNKGEYTAEYAAARETAETPEYAEVRKIHPKVERKLGEIVRHHDGRRARCRGRPKVLLQELLATLVVNARRIVQMLCAQSTPKWG